MDVRALQAGVEALQRDLLRFRAEIARERPDFEARIARQLSQATFEVRPLASDAAFDLVSSNHFIFNANSFRSFHAPIEALERSGDIDAETAACAKHMANEQLVVHELTHVGVGLVHFEDVQPFKELVGNNALAELDIVADGAAAHICALLEHHRAGERGELAVARRYLHQLFLMGNFALPAFRAPADKPHKRRRFLGLAMMAARANTCLASGTMPDVTAGELPLYAPIYPYTTNEGDVIVCAFNPDRIVWGRKASVDRGLLAQTLDELDTAPFALSVHRASTLLQQIGRLSHEAIEIPAEAASH
jgi:hypothetical protein